MHDGPGVRTTVFFKGCPLRCQWCHNPETQKSGSELLFYKNKCIFCKACEISCRSNAHYVDSEHVLDREKCSTCFECAVNCPTGALEICGNEMTIDDIMSVVMKDTAFYGNNGGITLSGGEPLVQKDAALALLKVCKESGITTAVETCGHVDPAALREVLPFVDMFLWDLKDTDDDRHKHFTGVSNKLIIENLEMIGKTDAKIRLRCILVKGVNTEISHYQKIAAISKSILNLDGVELIPYHAYAGTKATFLGKEDNGRVEWIPDDDLLMNAREILRSNGVKLI